MNWCPLLISQSVRNQRTSVHPRLLFCQFWNRINVCNVIFKFCNKFHCILFFNCPLCLNFPFWYFPLRVVRFCVVPLQLYHPTNESALKRLILRFAFSVPHIAPVWYISGCLASCSVPRFFVALYLIQHYRAVFHKLIQIDHYLHRITAP